MNPGELLAWVGAISLSVVIVVLAVAIVVASVRSIKNPKPPTKRAPIFKGEDQL